MGLDDAGPGSSVTVGPTPAPLPSAPSGQCGMWQEGAPHSPPPQRHLVHQERSGHSCPLEPAGQGRSRGPPGQGVGGLPHCCWLCSGPGWPQKEQPMCFARKDKVRMRLWPMEPAALHSDTFVSPREIALPGQPPQASGRGEILGQEPGRPRPEGGGEPGPRWGTDY